VPLDYTSRAGENPGMPALDLTRSHLYRILKTSGDEARLVFTKRLFQR
jgi:hypothetical protein